MKTLVAIACLFAAACASETQSRPPREAREEPHVIAPTPTPFPDTAFTCASCAPPSTRFETRVIGETTPQGTRYRGAPVDLDFKGADLQDVFRLLADVGKVNIVVAGEISGTITMKMRRVPWDQALDVVARAKGLALERDGNVILVRPEGAKK